MLEYVFPLLKQLQLRLKRLPLLGKNIHEQDVLFLNRGIHEQLRKQAHQIPQMIQGNKGCLQHQIAQLLQVLRGGDAHDHTQGVVSCPWQGADKTNEQIQLRKQFHDPQKKTRLHVADEGMGGISLLQTEIFQYHLCCAHVHNGKAHRRESGKDPAAAVQQGQRDMGNAVQVLQLADQLRIHKHSSVPGKIISGFYQKHKFLKERGHLRSL